MDPVKRGFTTFPFFLSTYIWVKTVTQKRHLKVHKRRVNSVDEHKNTKSTQENTKGTLFGSCLLWVMSTEISVDIAVNIAVDSRSI